jgi:hypothetical protein
MCVVGAGSLVLLAAACGGIRKEAVPVTTDTRTLDARPGSQAKAGPCVKIVGVRNATGNAKYDALCQYVHIKTAQVLQDSGKFRVFADDFLASDAPIPLDMAKVDKPDAELTVEIEKVREIAGATMKVAIFSAQSQQVQVAMRLRYVASGGRPQSVEAHDASSKGAWGVVAQVNRDSLVSKKGVWALDESMAGIAAQRALGKAIGQLVP